MTIDEMLKRIKEKMACDYNISGCDTCNISSCEDRYIVIQLAEWLEELKALRLLLDWAIECDFGLDSFPEEYEKYKHTLTDDMTYKDMMIQIAKCVVAEEIKERTEK